MAGIKIKHVSKVPFLWGPDHRVRRSWGRDHLPRFASPGFLGLPSDLLPQVPATPSLPEGSGSRQHPGLMTLLCLWRPTRWGGVLTMRTRETALLLLLEGVCIDLRPWGLLLGPRSLPPDQRTSIHQWV